MTTLPIAALVYTPDTDPAPVLTEVARRLAERGVALAGAVQHDFGPREMCGMELELLPSGRRLPMSQELGAGSTACRLDPAAMADAAVHILKAIQDGPALALFNKFGAQEASGEGLRDEMAEAVMAGVPLLTAVGERFLAEWGEFTGGESTLLECSVDAALAWWDQLAADAAA